MKASNKILLILFGVIFVSVIATIVTPFVLSGQFSSTTIRGNGIFAEKTFPLKNFDSINIKTAGTIKIIAGKNNEIKISGDSNLLPFFTYTLDKDKLTLNKNKNINPLLKLEITITAHNLRELTFNSAGSIHLTGINNEHLILNAHGLGNIIAAGKTKELDITSAGAGNIICKNLIADNVAVSISGMGNVIVYSKHKLNATIKGLGNIIYSGDPETVVRNITGLGNIKKINNK